MAITNDIVKERISSIVYGIFLWILRITSPTQSQNEFPHYGDDRIGLPCILSSTTRKNESGQRRRILHYSSLISSRKASPPPHSLSTSFFSWDYSSFSLSWSRSRSGDLLGTESGVHMSSGDDAAPWENVKPYTCRRSNASKREAKKRDIPPPITLLRGVGNRRPIPWRLKREYADGRLILREETVEQFEYIESIRENGRLVMNLVHVDNTANPCDTIDEENDEEGICDTESLENGGSLRVFEHMKQNAKTTPRYTASLPDFAMENETRNVAKLRKCVSYSEGLASMDFSSEEGICDTENLEKGNSLRVFEHMIQNAKAIHYAASLPDFAMENETKNVGKLRKLVSYSEGLTSMAF